jgi:hypothetical protein
MIKTQLDITVECDKCENEIQDCITVDMSVDIKEEVDKVMELEDWEIGKNNVILCEECQFKYDELRS